ncbi:hypothetical protein VFPPC_13505 [Pochonia chlamydosporia 170]|uniref:MARVEL domain-containing protein n=1 Tax=Pochonia chlamydosporia 170 TaxID=1380566 RepID=A0A179G1V5_METCM|nr:hypothetical protein VFPPC_13505 [Pochonia chlamydosporia 170]OAQ71353.2 hypothetical protein VFPPC_13505 [Pochonia chlamydosporia 170]
MNKFAAATLANLRLFRWWFVTGVLIMNSIFLGKLQAYNLPVDHGIIIAEGFAAAAYLWNTIGLVMIFCTGLPVLSWILIATEAFMTGAFIFTATVYKAGVSSCNSYADTPFGANANVDSEMPSIQNSCGMQKAMLALSIIIT